MNDSDNKIDILITRHLGKQLDRHVALRVLPLDL